MHGFLPNLHSELHGLISVRGALRGDLEHRVNQLRDCESEVEQLRSRTGGGVLAHVYQGLRDQLQGRLVSVAEERGRLGSEVHMLQQTVADHETTIIGLQRESSWATNGAMSVEVPGVVRSTPTPPPPSSANEWARDLAETLARADRVVGGTREPDGATPSKQGALPAGRGPQRRTCPTGS